MPEANRTEGSPLLPAEAGAPTQSTEPWFLPILEALAARVRVLIALPLLVAVIAVGVSLLKPRFDVRARFAPQVRNQATSGALSGIAAQFGLAIPLGDQGQSVDFYEELVTSPQLLLEVAGAAYVTAENDEAGTPQTLWQIFDLEKVSGRERNREMLDRLQDQVSATADRAASLVAVRVEARSVGLAEQIARRILDLVNEFNLEKRQSQAAAERAFVEERLEVARTELEAAEQALEEFQKANRQIVNSPSLQVEAGRLQRRVDLQQQVYVTLSQAYEQARIEQVRNTPLITVVDAPEGMGRRANHPLLSGALGVVFGFALALVAVVAEGVFRAQRRLNPSGVEGVERAAAQAWVALRGRGRSNP